MPVDMFGNWSPEPEQNKWTWLALTVLQLIALFAIVALLYFSSK